MRTLRTISLHAAVIAVTLCLLSPLAIAQEVEHHEGLRERSQMFGDWGGARTALAQRGIIVDLQATQFYQGVTTGSSDNNWKYGLKSDLFATLLGEKLGLWKGLIVDMHLEGRAGDDVNALSGLSPANSNLLMPNSDDTVALTQLLAIQMFSDQVGAIAGKVNAFNFMEMVFHTGRGVDGFMNASLVFPVGLAGSMPLAMPIGFLAKFNGKEIQGFAGVYDPNNCATTTCLDPLLADGPAYAAFWKFYTGIGPVGAGAGYISFGGTYSTKQYTVVDPQSVAFIPGQGLALTDTDTTWSLFSVVNQQLWADPSNMNRHLNFRGMYTITDGRANPIAWTANVALEMTGLIPRRDKDVFGIGYFHTELSDDFKGTVGPLLSAAATLKNRAPTRIAIKDTDGFEAYYKAQVTPWFAVTGDVQVITETLSTEDTKVVAGVRTKVTF